MTVVVQSFHTWLPATQTWAHNQIRALPAEIVSHVVCRRTANLDRFPIRKLHSSAPATLAGRLAGSAMRRFGLRPHERFLGRRVGRLGARVVHSHFGDVGWADHRPVRRSGARHVVTFYGVDVSQLPRTDPRWRVRYPELFAEVALVLCEGPHMLASVRELGCPVEKSRVLHLGVHTDAIEYRPRRWDPGRPLRVLMAASFTEKKGIPLALEALGRLRRELPVEITIIGDARSERRFQQEKARIVETIDRHGLGDVTRRLGYQPYPVIFEEAYRHDLFLSPSVTAADGDTEGGAPVTLIEMAASGMPVVSTRHCDIPEVIEDGVTGALAEERDVGGLLGRIRWLLDRRDDWETMLDAGRRRVVAEFDVARQAARLAGFYQELAAGRPLNPDNS